MITSKVGGNIGKIMVLTFNDTEEKAVEKNQGHSQFRISPPHNHLNSVSAILFTVNSIKSLIPFAEK